ncbi:MAG: methylase domain protein [Gemmatimonadetes bacterium]|nr:methylase domain protein [Gemmatimonadota bacterium]
MLSPALQVAIDSRPEAGIRIDFPGKPGLRAALARLRPRSQRRLAQYCAGPEEEQTRNLVVEGDNLQVMGSLYRFRGQIDLVVADPPYNTGNDFRYNDRWDVDPNDPDPGPVIGPDDGGRHSKWMRFMAPRLEMMRAMLKPGGVCAVCIDERELFRLGMMMDETFGEHNRIAIINWQKSYAAKNDSAHVSTATEYVLVYAKSKEKARTGLLGRTDAMDRRYRAPDGDPEPWKAGDLNAKAHPKPEDYGIQSPFTGEIHYPAGHGRWRLKRSELKRLLEAWGSRYVAMEDPACTLPSLVLQGTELRDGRLVTPDAVLVNSREQAIRVRDAGPWPQLFFQSAGEGRPSTKRYLRDVKRGRVPTTYWADEEYETPLVLGAQSWGYEESGHSQSGVNELSAIIGPKHGFETVKPLRLITKIIQIWCPPSGIVLDPFAGSGTTGHAVLHLNDETGAERRFILIEQSRPEKGDPYARTLTAERVRRVAVGDWYTGPRAPLGGGFTFKTSTTQIDRRAVLAMQREEMCDLILLSHWDARNRKGPLLTTLTHKDYRYLVAKDASNQGYYLVWEGPDASTPLTVPALAEIIDEARREGLSAPYHVYARISHVLMPEVIFYQIPDEILSKIGFNDSLGEADER